MRKSDDAALRPYRQLQRLLSSLRPLQDEAEGAAPHLLDHLSRTTRDVQRQIRDAYCADLEAVLRKLEWPKASAAPRGPLQEEWDHCVGRLLDFQMPELEAKEASRRAMGATPDPEVLLPLEVLVRPLETRFRYHFDGDRPTNRLDKPEYFLSHVADLVGQYSDFVETHVQPLLQGHFRGTDLAFSTIYVDAVSALITAFLPMLRSKVFSVMPKVAAQPQLLSHFMHEVMNFDSTIRDEWRYDGGYGMEGWKGMAWEILVQKDWFGRWLQVEKDCVHPSSAGFSIFSLTAAQLHLLGTRTSSTPLRAASWTLKASKPTPQSPQSRQSGSTICWKPSPVRLLYFPVYSSSLC